MEEVGCSNRPGCGGIREMGLPEGALHREKRVAQGDRRMGQPAGVDDRGVEVALVQPIDEGTLVVRLEEGDVEPELGRAGRDLAVDVVERVVAVDLWLACPDEVEVRALEHEHAGHAALPTGASRPAATRSTSSLGTSSRITMPSAVRR